METALQSIFWLCVGLLSWSYLVYPALLPALARRGGRQPAPILWLDAELPRVAVVVAAFNEQSHIAERIVNLQQQVYPADRLLIYIGSDGSNDGTVSAARAVADVRTRVCEFPENRGKASVLNDLMAIVATDIVVFTDANTVFEPDTIHHLVVPFSDPEVGAVCGELLLGAPGSGSNEDHSYWNIERRLKAAEAALGGLLGANGGVYAMRRQLYRPLPADMICDDFVTAMDVAAAGWRMPYVPAAAAHEDTPDDVAVEFQRRVRIGIGNYQALFRRPEYLLAAPWMLRFTYVSHKVLRWLTPHLLCLALVLSIVLAPRQPYATLAWLQAGGYLVAAGIYVSRERVRWPRAARAAMFVLLLNAAFAVAFVRFVRGDYQGSWRRTDRT